MEAESWGPANLHIRKLLPPPLLKFWDSIRFFTFYPQSLIYLSKTAYMMPIWYKFASFCHPTVIANPGYIPSSKTLYDVDPGHKQTHITYVLKHWSYTHLLDSPDGETGQVNRKASRSGRTFVQHQMLQVGGTTRSVSYKMFRRYGLGILCLRSWRNGNKYSSHLIIY